MLVPLMGSSTELLQSYAWHAAKQLHFGAVLQQGIYQKHRCSEKRFFLLQMLLKYLNWLDHHREQESSLNQEHQSEGKHADLSQTPTHLYTTQL